MQEREERLVPKSKPLRGFCLDKPFFMPTYYSIAGGANIILTDYSGRKLYALFVAIVSDPDYDTVEFLRAISIGILMVEIGQQL